MELAGLSKKVVLVELRYPYGKSKIYMSGSLCATAARLLAAGHSVEIIDLNIDSPGSERVMNLFGNADIIGVSVIGSPYIPSMISFAKEVLVKYPEATLIVGGQVIRGLTSEQFSTMFAGTEAIQIREDEDLAKVLKCRPEDLPSPFRVPYSPVWKQMDDDRLRHYLETEFALVVSQGCIYRCAFCAAVKGQKEQFVSLEHFQTDILFLARSAKRFGLQKLECYTSSLDLFQNPEEVAKYLQAIASAREATGIDIKVRCLACMASFLRAAKKIGNFGDLIRRSGLWCIGFGVDGTDEQVWKLQKKGHNHLSDVLTCLDLCGDLNVRAEILLVFGFPQDNVRTLWTNVVNSMRFARGWENTVLRPYLAKPFVPGNEGWSTGMAGVQDTVENPEKFFNFDFCAIGSRLTHPRLWHRWACNAAYLGIIIMLTPFNACVTSPLLPQGNGSSLRRLANRLMPVDR